MKEMSKIVKTASAIVYPLALIFGYYIVIHGHVTPGGGFQGGAIIATAIAMVIVAFGTKKTTEWYSESNLSTIESLGAVGFVGIGLLGIGTAFLYNFVAGEYPILGKIPQGINAGFINSGGTLLPLNVVIALKVFAGIGAVVFVFSRIVGGEKSD